MPHYAFWTQILGGTLKTAQEADILSESEISNWWRQLDEAEQGRLFFGALQGCIVAGRQL
jgi:hypothetical protein